MKSRPKLGRKLQRADRDRAEHARRLDQEEALDDALKSTFLASDPVSIIQPAPPAAYFDSVKSRRTHSMDKREAFWAAAYKFRSPKWSGRCPASSPLPTFAIIARTTTEISVSSVVLSAGR